MPNQFSIFYLMVAPDRRLGLSGARGPLDDWIHARLALIGPVPSCCRFSAFGCNVPADHGHPVIRDRSRAAHQMLVIPLPPLAKARLAVFVFIAGPSLLPRPWWAAGLVYFFGFYVMSFPWLPTLTACCQGV